MRKIGLGSITETVRDMFIEANYILPRDVTDKIKECKTAETDPRAKNILGILEENAEDAVKFNIPICQDTGMAVLFFEIGSQVCLGSGNFKDAVNDGVRQAYENGLLRKSVVNDPLARENTGDNTPAVIYTEITEGDKIKITALPKGFGSENMSRLKMFNPSAGEDDIVDFVAETVRLAGANPCPPVIIGLGIGGTFDYCAVLAKKALAKPLGSAPENYAGLAEKILKKVNETGCGVQGLGGKTTALGVNIEVFPTHIASLPVAVNISCHVGRHCERVL